MRFVRPLGFCEGAGEQAFPEMRDFSVGFEESWSEFSH
jgi:hypothetical protein